MRRMGLPQGRLLVGAQSRPFLQIPISRQAHSKIHRQLQDRQLADRIPLATGNAPRREADRLSRLSAIFTISATGFLSDSSSALAGLRGGLWLRRPRLLLHPEQEPHDPQPPDDQVVYTKSSYQCADRYY